jgi:hypothetical protein
MKMGRRLRCSSVTYRFRYAPSSRPAAAGPAAHFDRNESHVTYGTGHSLPRLENEKSSRRTGLPNWAGSPQAYYCLGEILITETVSPS